MYERTYPCENNQEDAGLVPHDGWVVQWLADGHIVINSHEDEDKDLHAAMYVQCKDLSHALIV